MKTETTIHLEVCHKDFDERYKRVLDDKLYDTPETKEAYTNYRKHRNSNKSNDLLEMFLIGMVNSGFDGIRQLFSGTVDKEVRNNIDEAVKEAVKGVATFEK